MIVYRQTFTTVPEPFRPDRDYVRLIHGINDRLLSGHPRATLRVASFQTVVHRDGRKTIQFEIERRYGLTWNEAVLRDDQIGIVVDRSGNPFYGEIDFACFLDSDDPLYDALAGDLIGEIA